MSKESQQEDRNFDTLAKRFKRNIYGGLKGDIRLAVLNRDFERYIPIAPFVGGINEADVNSNKQIAGSSALRILDAGGGQGQFSLRFAQAGHRLVICDISIEMLKLAQEEAESLGVQERVEFVHCAIQDLPSHLSCTDFDVVLCHAVMEWMQEPKQLLPLLLKYLVPQGYLSLTYYNLNSLVYKNLLRTNFKKIIQQDFGGTRGSLTPINPMAPSTVDSWLSELPLEVISRSGIRVFHDYIFSEVNREREPDNLIALELQFSTLEPFLSLGRYIHVLATKNTI